MSQNQNGQNGGGESGSAPSKAPGIRRKKLVDRYEASLEKSKKHSRKRIIIVLSVLAVMVALLVFGFTKFSEFYQAYKLESMLNDPKSAPAEREKLFEKIKDNNPAREDIYYLAVEKGEEGEKILALDELFKMNSPGLKAKCLEIWNDPSKSFSYNVKVQALGIYYDLAEPSDYEVFFNAIALPGGFGFSDIFYREKADIKQVIKLALEKASSPNVQDRINSAHSFYPIYDLPEVKDSSEVMSTLIALLSDNSAQVRTRAIWTVAEIAGPEHYDILMNILENDPDSDVRRYAAKGLGRIRDPRAAPSLIALLVRQESRINEAAADALIEIGNASQSREVCFPIIAGAKNVAENESEDPEIREYAVKVLGSFKYNESIDILVNIVKTVSSKKVVMAAVSMLGTIGSTRVVPALTEVLEEMLGDRSKADLRICIVGSLNMIKDARAAQVLLKALETPQSSRTPSETDEIGRALDDILGRKTEISSMLSETELKDKVKALRRKLGIQ